MAKGNADFSERMHRAKFVRSSARDLMQLAGVSPKKGKRKAKGRKKTKARGRSKKGAGY